MKIARIAAKAFGTAFSLALLIGWVSLCSFVFWRLLASTPEGVTGDALRELAWPFVTILVSVPLLAIVLLGGLEMLRQVLSLRSFLSDLPNQVSILETLGKRFESSKDLIADAAAAIDQSTSQLADVEARVQRIGSRQNGELPSSSGESDLLQSLTHHLERAKNLFDEAAGKFEKDNPQGVARVRGWILPDSVDQLRRAGYLDSKSGRYVDAALEVDRRTRRAGRSNLKAEDIQLLNTLEPK